MDRTSHNRSLTHSLNITQPIPSYNLLNRIQIKTLLNF